VPSDRPEWLDLLSAIRRDIEQLRADLPVAHNHATPPSSRKKFRKKKRSPVTEEWGFFDPEQTEFGALVAKLNEISGP
jgi:hypothetical protein